MQPNQCTTSVSASQPRQSQHQDPRLFSVPSESQRVLPNSSHQGTDHQRQAPFLANITRNRNQTTSNQNNLTQSHKQSQINQIENVCATGHESEEPTPALPDPIEPPKSPVDTSINQPTTAAGKLKAELTPDDVMAGFEKKTLKQLRDLQRTHVIYKRLNLQIKLAAQNLYFEYQTKQHLLSLKHRRPFSALTKYLGQRRSRQKQSSWHKFQKHNESAQEILHNTELNIGQRNKALSQLYKQAEPTSYNNPLDNPMADLDSDPNAEERGRFGHIFKSDKKVQQEVKLWAEGVQLKLKELGDQFGIEGFLVLAGQEHRKPFFFQGGSFYGDEYLRGLVDEGDPIREFAVWTAGSKKTIKRRKKTSLTQLLLNLETSLLISPQRTTKNLLQLWRTEMFAKVVWPRTIRTSLKSSARCISKCRKTK
ncbi:hypothetical protein PGTUg99_037386 [Puccinia graminis f. sp. tritici]|uniref:Uncharacterized protein n=1 Tax=Puccinia graminis f. sp. tritici TaxID=56615 RepID=A0A5B0RPG4_PUCGR|nr:hypothetical protein PGTUg99_037386 [Puccinia graminis f. sp. tritici]